MKRTKAFLCVMAALSVFSMWGVFMPGGAAALSMNFTYTGYEGSTATASGHIDFAADNPTSGSSYVQIYDILNGTSLYISNFEITVYNSQNYGVTRTFTLNDYDYMVWSTGTVWSSDPTTAGELKLGYTDGNVVGDVIDETYGTMWGDVDPYNLGDPTYGAFSFVALSGSDAPSFYDYFLLQIPGDQAEFMRLDSLTATPEPSTMLLLGVGLAGFALFQRRRGMGSLPV